MEQYDPAYQQAASVLPPALRRSSEAYECKRAEEFRLRVGMAMSIVLNNEECVTASPSIKEEDLRTVLEQASRASAHTVLNQLHAGFITMRGGHRIGLCGEVSMKNGQVHALRRLTSMSIRIARPLPGIGSEIIPHIKEFECLCSTLILAPPGAGKTTLLREIIRCVSDGIGIRAQRVGIADERREISALWEGQAQFDLGRQCDVLADCPKAVALEILLRGMNPQVLAMDEITSERDIDALIWAAGCGVTLLATAHGRGMEDLGRRPLYHQMMKLGLFQRVIRISNQQGLRTFTVEVVQ